MNTWSGRLVLPLPVGITGFRHQRDAELPQSDFRSLLSNCYDVARLQQGKVAIDETIDEESVANYERITLQLADRSIDVLLNAHYPLLAFAEPIRQEKPSLHFRDESALAAQFCLLGDYQPLDTSLLASAINPDAIANLSSAEREQIAYWKPTTLGELIFNNWD